MMPRFASVSAFAALALTTQALADMVALVPDRDNTLVEDATGSLSMGQSYHMYAGRVGSNGEGLRRRALVRFDIAGAIPAGSTITAVTLKLHMAQSNTGNQTVHLRRMLADWGEGASFGFGGGGAPAASGDATWLHQFWPGDPWSTVGGDFLPTSSASKAIGSPGFYTWTSTPTLVADVQGWLNDPATNFGWMLQGNEAQTKTVKKFDTRNSDNPAYVPILTVTYTPPPPCADADQDCDGDVDSADLGSLLAKWGTNDAKGDITGDGTVDGADVGALLSAWTG